MDKLHHQTMDETIYQKVLPNGLRVVLLPKREMFKTFGIFMTNYGAIDRTFTPLGKDEIVTVPDGIAHFLEHKLFEKKDRDVFQDFLNLGASPNAYTSFTKTAYLFSSTKKMEENVQVLLDFVQDPYFSDASVKKEKGIIGQEINMYDDQPDWRGFMGTLQNIYEKHPVRINIAGTLDSISGITKEDLYTCYQTFYHPSNMILFIVGNFEETKMMRMIENNQSQKEFDSFSKITRSFPDEPYQVAKKESVTYMPVSIPKITVGIKETNGIIDKNEFLKRDVLQAMLLDYFFSSGGDFHEILYDAELIDDSLEYSTTVEENFSFSLVSSNSNKPEECAEKIKSLLLSTNSMEIDQDELAHIKKKRIGQLLRAMNSLEFIANQYVHYSFMDIDFFEVIPYIEGLDLAEVNNFLQNWIADDRLTVHIMKAKKAGKLK